MILKIFRAIKKRKSQFLSNLEFVFCKKKIKFFENPCERFKKSLKRRVKKIVNEK